MTFGETISVDDVKAMKRQIRRSLWLKGRPPLEGSTSPEELLYLATTARRTNAKLIGEIGFNAGFSTTAFLSANPDSKVVSFDLVEHGYTRVAKKMVDEKFPGRHTLIAGDSTKAVPEFARNNPELRFDLIFIDGGHQYEVAKADIMNMMPMCTEKTAVIIDDLGRKRLASDKGRPVELGDVFELNDQEARVVGIADAMMSFTGGPYVWTTYERALQYTPPQRKMLSAVIAAASSPPPDLDWDEMALDDPVALDPRAWAAA